MGFNSAFKGLKLLKNPGNRCLNNLNDPVLNVLSFLWDSTWIKDENLSNIRVSFVCQSEMYGF